MKHDEKSMTAVLDFSSCDLGSSLLSEKMTRRLKPPNLCAEVIFITRFIQADIYQRILKSAVTMGIICPNCSKRYALIINERASAASDASS